MSEEGEYNMHCTTVRKISIYLLIINYHELTLVPMSSTF